MAVGSYSPNDWGLFDMHGNLFEWCYDGYRDDYENLSATDPVSDGGPGDSRVFRGGSWGYTAELCRSASRFGNAPDNSSYVVGFRVVRSVD